MFCRKCGAEIMEGGSFCCECGTPVGSDKKGTVAERKVRRGGSKLPVVIGGIVAGVLVVALIAVAVVNLIGGDAVKVANAFAKTIGAYSEAAGELKLPEVSELAEKGAYSADISLWIEEIPYYGELEGIGVRMDMDANLPKQKLGLEMTPYFGAVDLLTVQAKAEGMNVYVGSPEVTGDQFFMVNTKTLGSNLAAMGAVDPEWENLGFNIFELMEQVQEISEENQELTEQMQNAAAELVKNIEIEKTGSETIDVNGNEAKCTVYHVRIPKEAMADFLDDAAEAVGSVDTTAAYTEILTSMGLPAYMIEEFRSGMGSTSDIYGGLNELKSLLEDVELDLYLNKGYVVSAVYEGEIEGSTVVISLDLGGGKNYVDDLSMTVEAPNVMVTITSTGDHGTSSGVFTDETTVSLDAYGYSNDLLKSRLSYEPGAKDDNFSWKLQAEGVNIQLRGLISGGKNEMAVRLDKISVEADGEELALGLDYHLGSYKADDISIGSSVAILELSEDELMSVGEELSANMMKWAYGLYERYPELIDSIGDLF